MKVGSGAGATERGAAAAAALRWRPRVGVAFFLEPPGAENISSGAKSSVAAGLFWSRLLLDDVRGELAAGEEDSDGRGFLLLLLVLDAGESIPSFAVRAVRLLTSTAELDAVDDALIEEEALVEEESAAAETELALASTRLPLLRSLSLKADTGKNWVSAAYVDCRWAGYREFLLASSLSLPSLWLSVKLQRPFFMSVK